MGVGGGGGVYVGVGGGVIVGVSGGVDVKDGSGVFVKVGAVVLVGVEICMVGVNVAPAEKVRVGVWLGATVLVLVGDGVPSGLCVVFRDVPVIVGVPVSVAVLVIFPFVPAGIEAVPAGANVFSVATTSQAATPLEPVLYASNTCRSCPPVASSASLTWLPVGCFTSHPNASKMVASIELWSAPDWLFRKATASCTLICWSVSWLSSASSASSSLSLYTVPPMISCAGYNSG